MIAGDAYEAIISKYGRKNGEVWTGLARAQAGYGRYKKAVDSYKQAMLLLPKDEHLKKELSQVQNQAMVADMAQSKSETVIQALPYKKGLWAVLSAIIDWEKEEYTSYPTITNSYLTIYKGKPNSLKQIWRSNILGYPGHTEGRFNDVYLYIKDITGDGLSDLVIPKVYIGGSWLPSHIDIFTWRNGKPKHLLGAMSDEVLFVKDLNHDGRYEVMTDHAIGFSVCHAGQPRWLFTYAYKNGNYQLAERDFPSQYRDLHREIKTVLREFPTDYQLLHYLGRSYEIRREPMYALRAYRKAEKAGIIELAEMRKEKWDDLAARVSYELTLIRSRIKTLSK